MPHEPLNDRGATRGGSVYRWTNGEIEHVEQERCDAMIAADGTALQRLFSDEATWIHSSGQIDSREAFIEKITSGASRYLTINRTETTIRLYGDVAVSAGIATMTAIAGGVSKSLRNRYVNVWVADGSGFRLVSAQSTKVD